MLVVPQSADLFLFDGVDVDYALPYVSLNATLGYFEGLDASASARYRLHLGHTVALTLGGRVAVAPLRNGCSAFALAACDDGVSTWKHAVFGTIEPGIEGRTTWGLSWRAGFGLGGLLGRDAGSCRTVGAAATPCQIKGKVGVVSTQLVTLGYAF